MKTLKTEYKSKTYRLPEAIHKRIRKTWERESLNTQFSENQWCIVFLDKYLDK